MEMVRPHAHRKGTEITLPDSCRFPYRLIHLFQDPRGANQEHFSGFRKPDATIGPFQQARAQFIL
jgi:hypothetical protein